MKQICLSVSLVLCAGVLYAGGLDKVVAKISAVSSNSGVVSATTSKITGYINRLDLSFSTNLAPVYLLVAASNDLTGIATTIFTDSAISTNASYQYTNIVQRLSLYNEAITLTVTNGLNTPQTPIMTLFYERP